MTASSLTREQERNLITTEVWKFLPRRLLIRYHLLLASRPGDEPQTFVAEVIYVSPSKKEPFELFRWRYFNTIGTMIGPESPLRFEIVYGSSIRIIDTLVKMLEDWDLNYSGHRKPWVSNEEFVGRISQSGRSFSVKANTPQFTFFNGLLAAHLSGYVANMKYAASLDPGIAERVDSLKRFSERFSAFAAQTQHAAFEHMITTAAL